MDKSKVITFKSMRRTTDTLADAIITATYKKHETIEHPHQICRECALENGGKWPIGHIATVNIGWCGWCDELSSVCSPHNWGYPKYKG